MIEKVINGGPGTGLGVIGPKKSVLVKALKPIVDVSGNTFPADSLLRVDPYSAQTVISEQVAVRVTIHDLLVMKKASRENQLRDALYGIGCEIKELMNEEKIS
jgi:hypothetical protein